MRVIGYLTKIKNLGLQYSKFPTIIEEYTDTIWINTIGKNISTSKWIFTLRGGAAS